MDEPLPPPSRSERRRRASAVAMYNDVFLRLLLASIITFLVIFGLALVYLAPTGSLRQGAVAPVVESFLRRASEGDALSARLLLSAELLGSERVASVDELLRQPQLLYGYEGLSVNDFRILPQAEPGDPRRVYLSGAVRFENGLFGHVDASLVYEDDTWRLADLLYTAPGAGAP